MYRLKDKFKLLQSLGQTKNTLRYTESENNLIYLILKNNITVASNSEFFLICLGYLDHIAGGEEALKLFHFIHPLLIIRMHTQVLMHNLRAHHIYGQINQLQKRKRKFYKVGT